jgi:signal transduction histidine kinase
MIDQRIDTVNNAVLNIANDRELVDLVALVKEQIERVIDKTPGLELDFFHSENSVFIHCYRDMFEMTLSNLVNNSIMHAGSNARLVITLRSEAGIVQLAVQDDGPGVPSDELTIIFNKGQRGSGGGRGLGLYLVRRVIEYHSGSVVAQNCLPHGLRIVIRVPESLINT